jgi:hypothetical protein
VHPFSQKTALQQGLRDCALFLGLVPPSVDFKRMGGGSSRKGSMLVQFKYLDPPAPAAVYAPARHAEIIRAIYAHLDPPVAALFQDPPEEGVRVEGEPAYTVRLIRSLNLARIRVDRCGPGIVADVRLSLRELCHQRWNIIHLVLNLADPQTALFCHRFEELGFFFAGVLPLGLSSGDALVLQYLNIPPVPYSAIQAAGSFAADLAAYVQSCDPNPPTA